MSEIPKLNQEIMEACQLYVDNLIKPIHSLGKLEDMAVRMAGILGEVKPTYINKAVVIFGGEQDEGAALARRDEAGRAGRGTGECPRAADGDAGLPCRCRS